MKLAVAFVCALGSIAAAAPTGALDFDLTGAKDKYIVKDEAFQLTFPGKPEVSAEDQPANGVTVKTASAMYSVGNDVYGFVVIQVPKDATYDVKKGMDGARDGGLKNINGKVVKEDDITISGLKGRHTLGAADFQGVKFAVDFFIAWDEKHRTLVSVFTMTDRAGQNQAQKDFVASFKNMPNGKAPH
ncbi:MAG TPA: hypothetical protein VGC41_10660 [Kofleriaceae bacterium]